MVFTATQKNRYNIPNAVSLNLRLYYADNFDCGSPNHSYFANGASYADGIRRSALWNNSSPPLVPRLVRINQYSLFKMGKLTQGQKALFLWKSPLAKLQ